MAAVHIAEIVFFGVVLARSGALAGATPAGLWRDVLADPNAPLPRALIMLGLIIFNGAACTLRWLATSPSPAVATAGDKPHRD